MTEVKLNPDELQAIINKLTTFNDTTVVNARDSVVNCNAAEKSPFDLGSFSMELDTRRSTLKSQIDNLQTCLDAAKAANEGGITTSSGGMISYYVPDGQAESIEVIKEHNHVDDWRAAKKDAADLVKYSEEGCSPEQWDKLLARLQAKQDDPEYAAFMLGTIGPGRLLDIPIDIGGGFRETSGSGPARSTSNARPDAEKDAATVIGHLLAVRSRSWSPEQASKYANSLVQYSEEKNKGQRLGSLNQILSASRATDIDGDGNNETVGLDYDDTFLLTLARRLENYKSKGGNDNRITTGERGNSLHGVVHALTGSPGVATSWLTVKDSNGEVNDEKTTERIEKLINRDPLNREGIVSENNGKWEDDWLMLSARESIVGVKDRAGGHAHAAVTSGILNTVGTEGNADPDKDGSANGSKIELSDAGRNSVSIALSNYTYGVQQSASKDGAAGYTLKPEERANWGVDIPQQAVFSKEALTNLLGQVGNNDHAMARYVGAQEAFNKQQVAGSQGKDEALIKSVYDDQSQLRGFTAGAVARQSEIDGSDADQSVGDLAELTKMAITAIPLPQAKAAGVALDAGSKFALNLAKSGAADATHDGMIEVFGGELQEKTDRNARIREAASRNNTYASILSILGSNVYSQEELAAMAAANQGADISEIINDDGSLRIDPDHLDPNDPQLTDAQKQALTQIGKTLPVKNHPGMPGFSNDATDRFSDGYNDSHGQLR
ncbi:DUF6571 family protein [Actinomyces sp. ZJ308]|uniref:DUF6571 family protein n=1 Tax=Actinomyces sp. ZJ308 TaxID=2708342 RepID=UPI00141E485C|nr:DUF6571 family protein [Actinomyces sp. ZJ308]